MDSLGGYQLLESIGHGGMGAVHRAHDPSLGRDVALKVIRSGALANDAERRRFQREGEALARLRHPNVLSVHSAGVDQGVAYMVMDLVHGESLQDLLDRQGAFLDRHAVELFLPAVEAIAYAHEQGVLHRDLKPANLLLDRDGRVLVADFGLAKIEGVDRTSLSSTGTFLGTPGYWPPEQALGQYDAIGPASDIYSLGATLYALLTRQSPFPEDSLVQSVAVQGARKPPPPSRVLTDRRLDPALDRICLRCLQPEPKDRYPSASDLAADLRAFLSGRTGAVHFAWHRVVVGVLAVAVPGLVVLSVVTRDERGPPPTVSPAPEPPARPTATPSPVLKPTPNPPPVAETPEVTATEPNPDTAALQRKVQELTVLLRASPRSAAAYRDRGRAHFALGELKAAGADFDRAIHIQRSQVGSHVGRGWVRFEQGHHKGALEDFREAVRLDPNLAEAWEGCGASQAKQDNHQRAIQDLTRSIELDPNKASAYQRRGWAHHENKEPEKARSDFEQALRLNPDEAWAIAGRAELLAKSGRTGEAKAAWTRALALRPKDGGLYYSRAYLLRNLNEYDAALADMNRAIELGRTSSWVFVDRGDLHTKMGNHRSALEDFQRYLERKPKNVWVTLLRGEAHAHLKAPEPALRDAAFVLAKWRDYPQALILRARARLLQGDRLAAVEDATRARDKADKRYLRRRAEELLEEIRSSQ